MQEGLKKKLLTMGGAGALAIAAALGAYFEGTGPTQRDRKTGELFYVPYRDTGGILTVCRGVTGAGVIESKRYSEAECAVLEARHYAIAEASARRMFPAYNSYNEWQQAALLDWLYNLGENKMTWDSTLRAKFNRGDVDGGCDELVRWVNGRVKGKLIKLQGLVNRRETTQEICKDWGKK